MLSMKKIFHSIIFILLIANFSYPQSQYGNDITGDILDEGFGRDVSLSSNGQRIAVSSTKNNGTPYCVVKIYEHSSTSSEWLQFGEDIVSLEESDYGYEVSLSGDGDIIAIGAAKFGSGDIPNYGQVRIFHHNGLEWLLLGNPINCPLDSKFFGQSIDLSENGLRIAIGTEAYGSAFSEVGQVQIYEFNNDDWEQIGNSLNGQDDFDWFGWRLDLSGDGNSVVIGARTQNGFGYFSTYNYDGVSWSLLGDQFIGTHPEYNNLRETALSLSYDGKRLAVGKPRCFPNGCVSLYELENEFWIELGDTLIGDSIYDNFGTSIAMSNNGNVISVGANRKFPFHSRVKIYEITNDEWLQIGSNIDVEVRHFKDNLGLSTDGNYLSIGGPTISDDSTYSGLVRAYFEIPVPVIETSLNSIKKIDIYPNPFNDAILITGLDDESYDMRLYDSSGKYIKELSESAKQIDLSILEKGLYYIILQNNKEFIIRPILKI